MLFFSVVYCCHVVYVVDGVIVSCFYLCFRNLLISPVGELDVEL